jgi:hypothetical protein
MMVVVDGRDPGWNENRSAAECNNRREGACPDTSLTETEKGNTLSVFGVGDVDGGVNLFVLTVDSSGQGPSS